MKNINHPSTNHITLPNVLYALSDPIRLQIVKQLAACGQQTCGSFDIAVVKSTLSHHFRVLREAGIIRVRTEGTQRFISLRREDLETLFPGLLNSILQAAEKIEI
jgi:DNA-binding transcriptional ArsR family regulator